MAITPVSTAAFVRAVRKFAEQTPDWSTAIRYQTLPDERFDITLTARRVYGDRAQYMVIFAAAGLDTLEQELPEQALVLPNFTQLQTIKRQTGYLTDDEERAYSALD
ncbi:hypothetical protein [Paraburkholderia sp. C35]|uniref:hypothetical protein n=1 Tax=Paraburkholderia sp. C35 TaxID=2126993 RepID=UPI000D698A26|nr:hypothetical protein [Paraburkholderia sp. C35]